MAKDNKIHMPSGQGGLTRYFEDSVSKVKFSPNTVVILCIVVGLVIILLHYVGDGFLG